MTETTEVKAPRRNLYRNSYPAAIEIKRGHKLRRDETIRMTATEAKAFGDKLKIVKG